MAKQQYPVVVPQPTAITFAANADTTETEVNLLTCLVGYHVELSYVENVSPYCSNPVAILSVDDSEYALVVTEVDDQGEIPAPYASWCVPFDVLDTVTVL